MSPRSPLRTLPLLAALACGQVGDDSRTGGGTAVGSTPSGPSAGTPSGLGTGSPTAPVLELDTPTPADVDGGDQHHGTVALASDGEAWVSYVRDGRVRTRILGRQLVDDSDPLAMNHPQVGAGGDRLVAVAVLNTGGLALQSFATSGTRVGGTALPSSPTGRLPDLALAHDRGAAIWSEDAGLRCTGFDLDLDAVDPLPCDGPLVSGREVGTVAADHDGANGWIAWSEVDGGTAATVVAAPFDPELGAGPGTAVATVIDNSRDGRPSVASTEHGLLLAWRGIDVESLLGGAWLAAMTGPGEALEARRLGADGSNRPDLAVAGELAAVAWEQPDGIWLELVDPETGAALGEAVEITGSDVLAARPAVALRADEAGWQLVVTWESGAAGSQVLQYVRGTVRATR